MHTEQSFFTDFGAQGMPVSVSKKDFAEMIGVTQGRVSQMVSSGLPVEPNGRINVAQGLEWVRGNVDPNRRRAVPDAAPGYASQNYPLSPRAMRDVEEAKIARLKAEKLAGSLIDRKATLRAVENRARVERDAWIGWVNRAAPEISTATGADLATIVSILDRQVREQIAALAELPLTGIRND